jgi:cobalt/nickel transport system permease protein
LLEFWFGGAVDIGRSIGTVSATMAGSHLLIGVGEGLITAATVVTVAKVRPDLVYALRRLRPTRASQPVAAPGGAA